MVPLFTVARSLASFLPRPNNNNNYQNRTWSAPFSGANTTQTSLTDSAQSGLMGGVFWLTPLRGQINWRRAETQRGAGNSIVPLMKLPALMPPDKNLGWPKNGGLMLMRCVALVGVMGRNSRRRVQKISFDALTNDSSARLANCNLARLVIIRAQEAAAAPLGRERFRRARHQITQRVRPKINWVVQPCRSGEKGNARRVLGTTNCFVGRIISFLFTIYQTRSVLDNATHFFTLNAFASFISTVNL